MPVLALGISHRHAPIELLERLAIADDELPKAYRRLADRPAVGEAVVLSTCNRVEVYAEVSSYHAGFLELRRFLSATGELDPDDFAEPLSSHYEDHAAEHLFGVAAGLDSMVVGEPQILAQVRAAYRHAESEGATGPALASLFRAAVRTGRRVRAETAVGAAPEAFVTAGVDLAEAALGPLEGRSAAVVGAGAMASLAVGVLRARGVERIRVANRNVGRAAALAERHGAEVHGLHEIGRALAGADVVVTCTGAAGTVVRLEDVREALDGNDAAMFILDLAVPRDVEPAVADLPGVRLANVDALAAPVGRSGERAAAIADGRAIVAEEVERFAARRRAARLAPLIEELREKGERTAATELARAFARLPELSAEERRTVEALARGVVAKLLHDPIVRVKDLTGPGLGDAHARALADLFGLGYEPNP